MSIIETAYAETIAARLCDRIAALDVATAAYQTTGDALVEALTRKEETERTFSSAKSAKTAHLLTYHDLGKNAEQRAANLADELRIDQDLGTLHELMIDAREHHALIERDHKNAAAEMQSLRVAINGFAAVLGATR